MGKPSKEARINAARVGRGNLQRVKIWEMDPKTQALLHLPDKKRGSAHTPKKPRNQKKRR